MRGKRSLTFELERFESLAVGEGLTLLRVSGRWRSRRLERVADPTIVVNAGRGGRALDVLPDPGALPAFADVDPPPWRACFALPGELAPVANYMLRTANGASSFPLPQPTPGNTRPAADGPSSTRVEEFDRQLALAEREHARTEEALDVARRRLDEEIAWRQAAEEELEMSGTVDLGALRDGLGARLATLADTERRIAEIRKILPAAGGPPPGEVAALGADVVRRAARIGALEFRLAELRAGLAAGREAP